MNCSRLISSIDIPDDIPTPTRRLVERTKTNLRRHQISYISIRRLKPRGGYALRTRWAPRYLRLPRS
jgi:hypothetical protein